MSLILQGTFCPPALELQMYTARDPGYIGAGIPTEVSCFQAVPAPAGTSPIAAISKMFFKRCPPQITAFSVFLNSL